MYVCSLTLYVCDIDFAYFFFLFFSPLYISVVIIYIYIYIRYKSSVSRRKRNHDEEFRVAWRFGSICYTVIPPPCWRLSELFFVRYAARVHGNMSRFPCPFFRLDLKSERKEAIVLFYTAKFFKLNKALFCEIKSLNVQTSNLRLCKTNLKWEP